MCPVSTINLRYSQPNKSHSDQREYNPFVLNSLRTQGYGIMIIVPSLFNGQMLYFTYILCFKCSIALGHITFWKLKRSTTCSLKPAFCWRCLIHHYMWNKWVSALPIVLYKWFWKQGLDNINIFITNFDYKMKSIFKIKAHIQLFHI